MKRYLLIFVLFLSLFANGIVGAGMVCPPASAPEHSMHAAADVNSASAPLDMATTHAAACDDCGQSSCDTGHGCANCLAHCGGALLSAPLVLVAKSTSIPPANAKMWNVSSFYSRLLRPPQFS